MAGRPTKCCTIGIFKYLFHVFNIIFLFSGLGVLVVGVWSVFWRYHFVQIQTSHTYAIIVYTLLIIGILITVVNIIGYIGVWKENRCTIQYYIFFLLVIFLIEVAVGVMSHFHLQRLPRELKSKLNVTFVENYRLYQHQTEAIDYIQKRLRCCGAIRFEDWRASQWYLINKNSTTVVPELCKLKNHTSAVVPTSCCKTPSEDCGCSDHPNNIYYNGCFYKIRDEMRVHLSVIEWVAFAIAGLQFFGVLLSCILCQQVKNIY